MMILGFGPVSGMIRVVSHPLYITLTIAIGWGILSN